MFTIHHFKISSRRARGVRRGQRVITKFCVSYMLFLIFMMKINMKEESGYLITHGSLRLCASA